VHPNHENGPLYDGSPPQGIYEARQAGNFLNLVTDPPRKPCFGEAAFIVLNVYGGNNPRIMSECYSFQKEMLNNKLNAHKRLIQIAGVHLKNPAS
jgi:hypothetical protein